MLDDNDDDRSVRRVHALFKNDLLTFCRTVDEDGFAKVLRKCEREFRFRDSVGAASLAESAISHADSVTVDAISAVTSIDGEDRVHDDVDDDRIRTLLIPQLLNTSIRLGSSAQFTYLLHVAAQTGSGGSGGGGGDRGEQKRFVESLMRLGCDPSKRNSEGKTVYISTDKTIRVVLKDFRRQFPDKFDYEAAEIPAPPTVEEAAEKAEKQAERKKKLRQAKKEREKEKREEKAAEEKKKMAEREAAEAKRQFLALNDREKRALAAEKRFAAQTNRCWLCAGDMNGLVPFEYLDFKFCTVKCLQEHRKKSVTMR